MDPMVILTAVMVIFSMAGGFWGYNLYIEKKFQEQDAKNSQSLEAQETKISTVFRRMDENKDSYWRSFVPKEVYEVEKKYIQERTDKRFEGLIEVFSVKMDSIRLEIKNLTDEHRRRTKGDMS